MTNKKPSKWTSVPYHGAAEVHAGVRKVIESHQPGDQTVMSASIMVGILSSMGVAEVMANRLYSQIRKGGPLHEEWKEAFASGRFYQRCGKGRLNGSLGDEDDNGFGSSSADHMKIAPGMMTCSPNIKRKRDTNTKRQSPKQPSMSRSPRPKATVQTFVREVSPPDVAEVPMSRDLNDDFDAMGMTTVVPTYGVAETQTPFDGFSDIVDDSAISHLLGCGGGTHASVAHHMGDYSGGGTHASGAAQQLLQTPLPPGMSYNHGGGVATLGTSMPLSDTETSVVSLDDSDDHDIDHCNNHRWQLGDHGRVVKSRSPSASIHTFFYDSVVRTMLGGDSPSYGTASL